MRQDEKVTNLRFDCLIGVKRPKIIFMARGDHNKASDIDLALDMGRKIDFGIIGNIKEELEESTIPFFIDIVDLHDVDDSMKEEILKDGLVWKI